MNQHRRVRVITRPGAPRANYLAAAASAWLVPCALLTAVTTLLNHPPRREERGDVIVQHLGVILLAIVALVAMFAAIQLLGVDIITNVRNQLGL